MRDSDRQMIGKILAVTAALVALSFVVSYIFARFEAAAYERVTGKRVSAWDAMFLDLRVQEPTK